MRPPVRILIVLLSLAAGAADMAADMAAAQEKTPAPSAPPAAAPSGPANPSITIEQALYLIRSTLLALNDANHTGNYTVLRDLAAPDFQVRNTAADLALIFSDLRRRNFDLYGAALLAPQLTAPPAIDKNKRLRLTGYFPTRPQRIDFDLIYEVVNGQWRLFGISVITPDVVAAEPGAQAPAPSPASSSAPSAPPASPPAKPKTPAAPIAGGEAAGRQPLSGRHETGTQRAGDWRGALACESNASHGVFSVAAEVSDRRDIFYSARFIWSVSDLVRTRIRV